MTIILSIKRQRSKLYYDTNNLWSTSRLVPEAPCAGKGVLLVYVNSVIVVGNLTSDPRMREGDGRVVNFRMAVNRWRKPGQEADEGVKERTEFIDVECWGTQAENVNSTLKRGDRAIVAGQMKYDQWTDETGNARSKLRIKALAVGPSLEFQKLSG